jgi:hypothetical protein
MADAQREGLDVLETVRCLDCGAVYSKPAGGGTMHANPGCPDCTYVGWIPVSLPLVWHSRPRLASGRRRLLSARPG